MRTSKLPGGSSIIEDVVHWTLTQSEAVTLTCMSILTKLEQLSSSEANKGINTYIINYTDDLSYT